MPSFHCGVEVQAAIDAGLKVAFYPIRDDLAVNVDALLDRLRTSDTQPRAVLVIHYFGFAQPEIARLAKECCKQRCVLIEDCAHALFSRNTTGELGGYAPLSVYSLRKSLPVYDGGALKVNDERLEAVGCVPFDLPHLRRFTLRTYIRCLKKETAKLLGIADLIRRRMANAGHGAAEMLRSDLQPPSDRDNVMATLCQRIVASEQPGKIILCRRKNYGELDELLKRYPGYAPLFARLPPGTCPLSLPIKVPWRSRLLSNLTQQYIFPFVFGEYPHPQLPSALGAETAWMRSTIVGLPIHQQLQETDLVRIANVVGPVLADFHAADF